MDKTILEMLPSPGPVLCEVEVTGEGPGVRVKTGILYKEKIMKCTLCRNGGTKPGLVTVTLQRGETSVILKAVPTEGCENCGEYFLAEDVTESVLQRAELAAKNGAEVEILRFAA
jgi:YgiT-type zinc finger domain-containing protein